MRLIPPVVAMARFGSILYCAGPTPKEKAARCPYYYDTGLDRYNVKNFHGSLTTVVRAQNDTSKTANITDTIFDRTLV